MVRTAPWTLFGLRQRNLHEQTESPIITAIASAALTATVVGGVAIAQQTSIPAVITACVSEISGNVRIVSSTSNCKPNEASTTWNQQGPIGPPGADGADGVDGTDGVDGVSGYIMVQSGYVQVPPGQHATAVARCPIGKRMLGGGFNSGGLEVYSSAGFPAESGSGYDGWAAQARNPTDRTIPLLAQVFCADVL